MALPKDYETPKKPSNYMRWEEGKNKFRILSDVIVGYEWWIETPDGGRKPLRCRPEDAHKHDAPEGDLKHFWAMVVWNYDTERIQILEITQGSIQDELYGYENNPDWGDLKNYDITVTRTGKKIFDTKYTVQPSPPKAADKGLLEAYKNMTINLEALYDGDDPFATEGDSSADEAIKAGV